MLSISNYWFTTGIGWISERFSFWDDNIAQTPTIILKDRAELGYHPI